MTYADRTINRQTWILTALGETFSYVGPEVGMSGLNVIARAAAPMPYVLQGVPDRIAGAPGLLLSRNGDAAPGVWRCVLGDEQWLILENGAARNHDGQYADGVLFGFVAEGDALFSLVARDGRSIGIRHQDGALIVTSDHAARGLFRLAVRVLAPDEEATPGPGEALVFEGPDYTGKRWLLPAFSSDPKPVVPGVVFGSVKMGPATRLVLVAGGATMTVNRDRAQLPSAASAYAVLREPPANGRDGQEWVIRTRAGDVLSCAPGAPLVTAPLAPSPAPFLLHDFGSALGGGRKVRLRVHGAWLSQRGGEIGGYPVDPLRAAEAMFTMVDEPDGGFSLFAPDGRALVAPQRGPVRTGPFERRTVFGLAARAVPEAPPDQPLQPGEVALYADRRFAAPAWILQGEAPDLPALLGRPGVGGSLRLGPGTAVDLYASTGFAGGSVSLFADLADLSPTILGTAGPGALRARPAASTPHAGRCAFQGSVGRPWALTAGGTVGTAQRLDAASLFVLSLGNSLAPDVRAATLAGPDGVGIGLDASGRLARATAPATFHLRDEGDGAFSLADPATGRFLAYDPDTSGGSDGFRLVDDPTLRERFTQILRLTDDEAQVGALGEGEVALYAGPCWTGPALVLSGDVATLRGLPGVPFSPASVRLGPGTSVLLFPEDDYRGEPAQLLGSVAQLAGVAWTSARIHHVLDAQAAQVRVETRVMEDLARAADGTFERVPVYRAALKALDPMGGPVLLEEFRIWSTAPAEIEVRGERYRVSPTNAALLHPNATGELVVTVRATGLSAPVLMVRAPQMAANQRLFVYLDEDMHATLADVTGERLFSAKAGGAPLFDRSRFPDGASLEPLAAAISSTFRAVAYSGPPPSRLARLERLARGGKAPPPRPHGGRRPRRRRAAQAVSQEPRHARLPNGTLRLGSAAHDRRLAPERMTHPHWRLDFEEGGLRFTPLTREQARALSFSLSRGGALPRAPASFWDSITDVVTDTVDTVSNVASDAWETVQENFTTVADSAQNVTSVILTTGESVVEDAATGIEETKETIVVTFEYLADEVVDGVVREAQRSIQTRLDTVERVVDFAEMIFEEVGAAVDAVVEALQFLFAWEDILATQRALQGRLVAAIGQVPPLVERLRDDPSKPISSAFVALQEQIALLREALGVTSLDSVRAEGEDAGADADPKTSMSDWLLSKVMDLAPTIDPPGDSPFQQSALDPAILAPFAATIDALDATAGLDDIAELPRRLEEALQPYLDDPAAFLGAPMTLLLDVLERAARDFAAAATRFVDQAVDFLALAARVLQTILTAPIAVPLVSDLYRSITQEEMTLLGIACLFVAIPGTILVKLEMGVSPARYLAPDGLARGSDADHQRSETLPKEAQIIFIRLAAVAEGMYGGFDGIADVEDPAPATRVAPAPTDPSTLGTTLRLLNDASGFGALCKGMVVALPIVSQALSFPGGWPYRYVEAGDDEVRALEIRIWLAGWTQILLDGGCLVASLVMRFRKPSHGPSIPGGRLMLLRHVSSGGLLVQMSLAVIEGVMSAILVHRSRPDWNVGGTVGLVKCLGGVAKLVRLQCIVRRRDLRPYLAVFDVAVGLTATILMLVEADLLADSLDPPARAEVSPPRARRLAVQDAGLRRRA